MRERPKSAPPREPEAKRQWLFQTLGFLLMVAAAVAAVVYLPVFKLSLISVSGNSYVTEEDICRIAGVYRGQHMFRVATDGAAQNLRWDLRIERATVRRTFPNGIVIEVEERRPVACVVCEFGFLDLDRKGMVLNAYRVRHLQTIPLLRGVEASGLYIGDTLEEAQALLALTYLAGLDTLSLTELTELDLSDPQRVVAYTTGGAQIRVGALERLERKAALTQSFLEVLRTEKQPIEFIDLTYSQAYIPAIAAKEQK